MKHNPKISEVMTTDVMSVQRGQSVGEVWEILEAGAFHHVPVLDGSKPIGLVSSTDVLKLVYNYEGTDDRMVRTVLDHEFTLNDAMSTAIETMTVHGTVHQAADLMSAGTIHSVIVVDDAGDFAGIVTSTDLIRFLRDQI